MPDAAAYIGIIIAGLLATSLLLPWDPWRCRWELIPWEQPLLPIVDRIREQRSTVGSKGNQGYGFIGYGVVWNLLAVFHSKKFVPTEIRCYTDKKSI